jgi:hypothetical protein
MNFAKCYRHASIQCLFDLNLRKVVTDIIFASAKSLDHAILYVYAQPPIVKMLAGFLHLKYYIYKALIKLL